MRLAKILFFFLLSACAQSNKAAANAQTDTTTTETSEKINFDRVDKPELLPLSIRGLWAPTKRDCDNIDSDSRFAIGANWVGGYELYGVLQLSTTGLTSDSSITSLVTRFITAGEGAIEDTQMTFDWRGDLPQFIDVKTQDPDAAESEKRQVKPVRLIRCGA